MSELTDAPASLKEALPEVPDTPPVALSSLGEAEFEAGLPVAEAPPASEVDADAALGHAGGHTPVQPLGLPDLGDGSPAGPGRDLRLLADIQLELSVELGRSRLPLRELLSLAPGAVLGLDRTAGEPVDVLVNGKVVARGEVVVVDGDFGVRINEISEPLDRG